MFIPKVILTFPLLRALFYSFSNKIMTVFISITVMTAVSKDFLSCGSNTRKMK